jgi:hypothetical protein
MDASSCNAVTCAEGSLGKYTPAEIDCRNGDVLSRDSDCTWGLDNWIYLTLVTRSCKLL